MTQNTLINLKQVTLGSIRLLVCAKGARITFPPGLRNIDPNGLKTKIMKN